MQILITYLIVINIIASISFYIDKRKAIKGAHRISEARLLFLALIGGSCGALIAMYLFSHKTRKCKFKVLVPLAVIMHALMFICLVGTVF